MNKANKLGQKRAERKKESRAKVLKRRTRLREQRKLEEELNKIRQSQEPRILPYRNI